MSRRQRYQPKINKNSSFGLNITSLTDVFTILLVFLLQTYSTAEVEIKPDSDLRLPSSTTMLNPTESVRISLSQKELKIDESKIADVRNAQFMESDLEATDKNFIKPLFAQLDKLAKEQGDKPHVKDGKILLQADRALPYSTLRKVMYTASMAGFPQLKLITIVGD